MERWIRGIMTICLTVVVGFNTVHASPLQEQLKQEKTQLENNKSMLKDAQDKREAIESSIEELDSKIEDILITIDGNKEKIKKTENEIENTSKEIDDLAKQIEDQKKLLTIRVRALYVEGETNYLGVLLESNGIRDLIFRMDAIGRIISHDKKVVTQIKAHQKEVSQKKILLSQERDKQLGLKSENENRLLEMNNAMKSQQQLIAELAEQESLFSAQVSETQALVEETLRQINTNIGISTNSGISAKNEILKGSVSISDNSIISYAVSFLGTPYVWGGTTPVPGFDCSGFTKYVYAHFGVNVGRTTKDQIKDGIQVSRDSLMPGDLLFFGKDGIPNHMGIYIGNNSFIHAPRTGDVVKISPLTRKDYLTARRVK